MGASSRGRPLPRSSAPRRPASCWCQAARSTTCRQCRQIFVS